MTNDEMQARSKELLLQLLEMAMDTVVFVCAFVVFNAPLALLIFCAYWGIGATIDRNSSRIVKAIESNRSNTR